MKWSDPLDPWRMAGVLILLVGLIGLAAMFGLGIVQKETSYGLDQILTALIIFASGMVAWAYPVMRRIFGREDKDDDKDQ